MLSMAAPTALPPSSRASRVPLPALLLLLLAASSSLHAPAAAAPSGGHNITNILSGLPEYSEYNSYLTRTKVADEINSRETLTVLVLPNAAMKALAADHPLAAIKNALRLLTLLDYYDATKLHTISKGTVQVTTLLQATGEFEGTLGFVKITDLKGGKVGFGSTATGAKLDSTYTKSVKQFPYSISVLEITGPVVFPGLLDAPSAGSGNLTALLVKAGCKIFSGLIESSGVLKMYEAAAGKGLTVFAPNDEAFSKVGEAFAGAPSDVTTLSQAELVTLLQYHAVPQYSPRATLKTAKGRLPTLASGAGGKFDIGVVTRGDDVSLDTGLDTSRVASTVADDPPMVVLTVDNVLLPVELFSKAPTPAPGTAAPGSESPAGAPAAAPAGGKKGGTKGKTSPSPAPEAPTPSVHHHKSPPAPPAEGSDMAPAPADGPGSDEPAADEKSQNNEAATRLAVTGRRSLVAAAAGSLLQLLLLW